MYRYVVEMGGSLSVYRLLLRWEDLSRCIGMLLRWEDLSRCIGIIFEMGLSL